MLVPVDTVIAATGSPSHAAEGTGASMMAANMVHAISMNHVEQPSERWMLAQMLGASVPASDVGVVIPR